MSGHKQVKHNSVLPCYSPGMPVRVIKEKGAMMRAEQKRRERVKSSWEGSRHVSEQSVTHERRDAALIGVCVSPGGRGNVGESRG